MLLQSTLSLTKFNCCNSISSAQQQIFSCKCARTLQGMPFFIVFLLTNALFRAYLVIVLKALLLSRQTAFLSIVVDISGCIPISAQQHIFSCPFFIVFLSSPGCMVQLNFPPLFCRLAHFAVRENAFIWCRKNVALIQLSVLSLQLPVRYPGPR